MDGWMGYVAGALVHRVVDEHHPLYSSSSERSALDEMDTIEWRGDEDETNSISRNRADGLIYDEE